MMRMMRMTHFVCVFVCEIAFSDSIFFPILPVQIHALFGCIVQNNNIRTIRLLWTVVNETVPVLFEWSVLFLSPSFTSMDHLFLFVRCGFCCCRKIHRHSHKPASLLRADMAGIYYYLLTLFPPVWERGLSQFLNVCPIVQRPKYWKVFFNWMGYGFS